MTNEATKAYERYAKMRDKKKLTDYAVSKKAGISNVTLCDWKAGRYMPKFDKISLIAEAIGTTVSKIYGV